MGCSGTPRNTMLGGTWAWTDAPSFETSSVTDLDTKDADCGMLAPSFPRAQIPQNQPKAQPPQITKRTQMHKNIPGETAKR